MGVCTSSKWQFITFCTMHIAVTYRSSRLIYTNVQRMQLVLVIITWRICEIQQFMTPRMTTLEKSTGFASTKRQSKGYDLLIGHKYGPSPSHVVNHCAKVLENPLAINFVENNKVPQSPPPSHKKMRETNILVPRRRSKSSWRLSCTRKMPAKTEDLVPVDQTTKWNKSGRNRMIFTKTKCGLMSVPTDYQVSWT